MLVATIYHWAVVETGEEESDRRRREADSKMDAEQSTFRGTGEKQSLEMKAVTGLADENEAASSTSQSDSRSETGSDSQSSASGSGTSNVRI